MRYCVREPAPELGKFTPAQYEKFNSLKEAVTLAPVLQLQNLGLSYSIETESSEYQVGCSLFKTTYERD